MPLPFLRRLHAFKYMPAMIPSGRADRNAAGLHYRGFDGLIPRNPGDSAAKKDLPPPRNVYRLPKPG